jgi:hypothetical protein
MRSSLRIAQKSAPEADETVFPDNASNRRFSFKGIFALILLAIVFSCIGTVVIVEVWPSFGAQVASRMREHTGPQTVAQVESVVFQVQDTVKRFQYQLGMEQAEAPWEGKSPLEPTTFVQGPVEETPLALQAATSTHSPPQATETPASLELIVEPQDQLPEKGATPTPTPTSYVWQLPSLTPFGSMEGEGVWMPYLYDQDGNVVAVRTFLQPDPECPYTIVAVVAFDLTRTRLNFVLGFEGPSLPDGPKGDGMIPEEHRKAGVLLAAFNGGFSVRKTGTLADPNIPLQDTRRPDIVLFVNGLPLGVIELKNPADEKGIVESHNINFKPEI